MVPSLRRHASEHDGASDDAFGVGVDRERKREEKDRRGPKLNQYSNHNPHQTTDASGYTLTHERYLCCGYKKTIGCAGERNGRRRTPAWRARWCDQRQMMQRMMATMMTRATSGSEITSTSSIGAPDPRPRVLGYTTRRRRGRAARGRRWS